MRALHVTLRYSNLSSLSSLLLLLLTLAYSGLASGSTVVVCTPFNTCNAFYLTNGEGNPQFSGPTTPSYTIHSSSSEVTLNVPIITNNSGKSSGSIRLRLWALTSPYLPGAPTSGIVLAETQLEHLEANRAFCGVVCKVPYNAPSAGRYHIIMTLEEARNGVFYQLHYAVFSPRDLGPVGGGGGGGGSLSLAGNLGYQIQDNQVLLQADAIQNRRSTTSGSLQIKLWATSSPFDGVSGISGYELGILNLMPLSGNTEYINISEWVTYSAPPNGTYNIVMTLNEFNSGIYYVVDYHNFSGTRTFSGGGGGGGGGGSLSLAGNVGYQVQGGQILLEVEEVRNSRVTASGPLQVKLWATSTAFDGTGSISGYQLGILDLSPLPANSTYFNVSQWVAYNGPPNGTYNIVMTLNEYRGGIYYVVDYHNFSGTRTFPGGGGGGGGSTGKTDSLGCGLSGAVERSYLGDLLLVALLGLVLVRLSHRRI